MKWRNIGPPGDETDTPDDTHRNGYYYESKYWTLGIGHYDPVFVGVYDPNTKDVSRAGVGKVKLSQVEEAVRSWGTADNTTEWDTWFRSNDAKPRPDPVGDPAKWLVQDQKDLNLRNALDKETPGAEWDRKKAADQAKGLAQVGMAASPLGLPLSPTASLTRGLGNITAHSAVGAEAALGSAQKWLGAGATEIAPGVFRSADGLRQFRMTASDLAGAHGAIGPHVHFEALDAVGKVTENLHVPIKP